MSDVVAAALGRPPVGLERLTGGTKKGVYRLRFGDGGTAILYSWADAENYWPPAETVPDDPFTDASGLELFAANHAALTAARVRVPHLLSLDRRAGLAIVEDAGGEKLEALMERDPAAAAAPLAELGESLRRMHTATSATWGRLVAPAAVGTSPASPGGRRAEDVILDRALGHLGSVAGRDGRLTAASGRIEDHVRRLHAAISPRRVYGLVHGELGPDHVLVGPGGEPVMIDIEGLTHFDVEWEHAWLQMRFRDAYPALRPVELDPDRLELYRYAQVLALIEGPLRIAETDFPDRDWMLQLAEWNIAKALDLPE
ncbi:phosphotransferase family protein [Paractinoplanes deccanensis]|uniref:phosphotransferase n=1 Tax=Paractinoplanes deccanensis TaxID=113561 RepID=UPI001EF280AD|nr:phosphotransferase [Actinoplanes deccanensis]